MSTEKPPSFPSDPSWPSLHNPRYELFHIEHRAPLQPGGVYLTDSGDVFRFTLYWTFVFYIPAFVVFGLYAFFNLTFPPSRKRPSTRNWNRYKPVDDAAVDDLNAEEERLQSDDLGDMHDTNDIRLQPLSSNTNANANSYKQPQTRNRSFLSSVTTSHNWRDRYQTLRSDIVPPPSLADPQTPLMATATATEMGTTPTGTVRLAPPPTSAAGSHLHDLPSVFPPPSALGSTLTTPLRPPKKQNERRSRVTFALLVLFGFLALSVLGSLLSSAIIGFVVTGLYKAGGFYISTWVPFLWALINVLIGMLNVWPSVIAFI